MYEDVRANAALVKLSSLGTAFLATPWLLPEAAASEVLEYRGHHNSLDRLLAIQAKSLRDILGQAAEATEPERTSKGAVTVVFYNFSHTLLLQNWVYSAVRWIIMCANVCKHASVGRVECFNVLLNTGTYPGSISATHSYADGQESPTTLWWLGRRKAYLPAWQCTCPVSMQARIRPYRWTVAGMPGAGTHHGFQSPG